jgi:hypothetical protein
MFYLVNWFTGHQCLGTTQFFIFRVKQSEKKHSYMTWFFSFLAV